MKYIDAEKLIAEIERRKKQDVTFRERSILIDIETAIASLQQEQPEVDLEKAAQHVYESWMGGTMDDVRRDMVELGKALKARKEE